MKIIDQFNLARTAQHDFEEHARATFDALSKIKEAISVVIGDYESVQNEIDRLVVERRKATEELERESVRVLQELEQYKRRETAKVEADLGAHRDGLRREITKSQTMLNQLKDELARLQAGKETAIASVTAEIARERARVEQDLLAAKELYKQQIVESERRAQDARELAEQAALSAEEKAKIVRSHEQHILRLRDVLKDVSLKVS